MLWHWQVVEWIEATYEGEENTTYHKPYSCKDDYGRNPIVGQFFQAAPSILFKFETMKQNIVLLDSIIIAASAPLSKGAKKALFRDFQTLKDKDPDSIVLSIVASQTS